MEFDLSNVELSYNDRKRGLILPNKSSKELAEFMGILTGDGYINYYPSQYKYILEIAGHSKLDKVYLESYISRLVKDLFNLESSFSIKKGQNSMYLRLISKGLITYLTKIGFKRGKKGQIEIPKWITSNEELMLSFTKGMIDTDGSIHFRNSYPIISLSSKSKPLIQSIFSFLKDQNFILRNYYKEDRDDKRGFNSTIYRIWLNGDKNLSLWMKLINFGNKKHLDKLDRVGTERFELSI